MSKALTTKQRKFVSEQVKGATGAEAARKAGYAVGSAKMEASRQMTKVNVRETIDRRLAKHELLYDEAIKRGLQGDNEHVTPKGDVVNYRDSNVALKAADLYSKVRGLYAPTRVDANVKLGIVDLIDEANAKRGNDNE